MILNNNFDRILIIDFGSQFTQLIARRIRELGVYSEIISHKKLVSKFDKRKIKGANGLVFIGRKKNIKKINLKNIINQFGG